MKYGKDAGGKWLEFTLDGKVLLPEEVAKEYNKLKAAHEYELAELSQKYEAVVGELDVVAKENLQMVSMLDLADKRINKLLDKA